MCLGFLEKSRSISRADQDFVGSGQKFSSAKAASVHL
jgi:hypothetical protein